jgi:pimeloyl-ACP methyl ester carboxylesterase
LPDFRERRIAARDGLSLYLRDYGDPRSNRLPLLCLPGLTRNSADFARVAARQAGARRVVCPDYRGRGRSDYARDWRQYAPRTYLDDLAQLIAAIGQERVVVLGTSLGGLLAMGLAVLKPTAVAAVILNDIGPEVRQDGFGRLLDYISVDRPQPDWAAAASFLRRTLPMLSFRSDEDWREFARATYREAADGRLHFDWDVRLVRPLRTGSGAVPDLWPLFRALADIPVLALRGGASDILSDATFARMAEAKPDLVRVTVPGVGHAPSLDEQEARIALDDFLARF